jgi:hypothetical protein
MDNNLNTSPTVSSQPNLIGPYLNDLFQVIGQPVGGVKAFSVSNNVIGVNTFEDSLNPMDGKTSLREAINQANASPGVDYIVLKSGGTYNIRISGSDENANQTGDFDIFANGSVNILAANGAIINANGLERVFDVQLGAELHLTNLAVSGGNANNGGAIFNSGTVIIERSTFINNSAGAGGAIFNSGTAIINRSNFSHNLAGIGGAIVNNQKGVPGTVTIAIDRTTFSHNSASSSGGAIVNLAGTATIDRSTFSNNASGSNGGAIYHLGSSAFTTVNDSTIRDNAATNSGGGFFVQGGTVTLTRSRVLANTASAGGGIFSQSSNLILDNSQVNGNAPDDIVRG